MTPSLPPNFADIRNELDDIGTEVGQLSATLARMTASPPAADSLEEWQTNHICASATEKIYTGCERVMAQLVRTVDGVKIDHEAGWHSALLDRLRNGHADLRGPIISGVCFNALNNLRSFRHRERNSYGMQLDTSRVLQMAREGINTFALFRSEIDLFIVGFK